MPKGLIAMFSGRYFSAPGMCAEAARGDRYRSYWLRARSISATSAALKPNR